MVSLHRRGGEWVIMMAWLRLTKPGVVILLQVTAVCAVLIHDLTLEIRPPIGHTSRSVAITVLGGYLTAGGANAINMWYDRDIDPKMRRTSNRPIPSGDIGPNMALLFGISISLIGVIWFALMSGEIAAFWAVFSILFYVFIYTIWLKRSTVQNIVIGGLAGSTPPLIGWWVASGSTSLDWSGFIPFVSSALDTGSFVPYYMVALIFLWTPPHFWALALYKSKEYHEVGIPMMPGVKGAKRTILEMRMYGCLLLLTSFIGPYLIFHESYSIASISFLVGSVFVAIWYVRTLFVLNHDEEMDNMGRMPKAARSFWVSQVYLGLMFLMALFASSGQYGSVIGSILAVMIIVRSEKKFLKTGNPFV
ncbi:MAG: protoheme IX farnesyltransferase [Euryarchaeota archaeon]|nr:protoheme IX farnesyltransferase [Euryarchaeota archaeon]